MDELSRTLHMNNAGQRSGIKNVNSFNYHFLEVICILMKISQT